jgi:hypothetical protein
MRNTKAENPSDEGPDERPRVDPISIPIGLVDNATGQPIAFSLTPTIATHIAGNELFGRTMILLIPCGNANETATFTYTSTVQALNNYASTNWPSQVALVCPVTYVALPLPGAVVVGSPPQLKLTISFRSTSYIGDIEVNIISSASPGGGG